MASPDGSTATHLVAFTTAPRADASSTRWEALAAALPELHPYEVPELVAVPVAGGHSAYLRWLSDATAEPGPRKE